jgi:putative endonuclease
LEDWLVYLLKCSDGSLYCGITNNIEARIEAHNTGKGAKYTKGRRPVKLIDKSLKMTRSHAHKFEILIKKLPAERKIPALKKGYDSFIK